MYNVDHGRPVKPFFYRNPKLLGLDRQFGQIHFGAFGLFSANSFWYCESLVHVFHFHQPLFLQKTKPLIYQNPKYLFGIGIWIWVAKNYGFSHRVSVVRGVDLEEPSIHAWHTFDHKWSWREVRLLLWIFLMTKIYLYATWNIQKQYL